MNIATIFEKKNHIAPESTYIHSFITSTSNFVTNLTITKREKNNLLLNDL